MSRPAGIPRPLGWTLLLGIAGLALAVPFSAPDGTGMQWDELVLGAVASALTWPAVRRLRAMDRDAARDWYPTVAGAAFFAIGQLLAASFPGPEFDGFGPDEVILFMGATSPLISAAMVARRVGRSRWWVRLVDGAVITVAMLVVTRVLHSALADPADERSHLTDLALAYGVYGAVALGAVGALCTVSTSALRGSATALLTAFTCQSIAAGAEEMAILAPSPWWTAVSGLAVAASLLALSMAVQRAPLRLQDRGLRASAPVVSPAALVLVTNAMLALPAAMAVSVLADVPFPDDALLLCAVVVALMVIRSTLRARDDERVTEDLVRSEEGFRELVESSSDGVAIMDHGFRLLFASPAARTLLGTGSSHDASLLDLVVAGDRAAARALAQPDCPPLHLRVAVEGGGTRELEVTSSERPGGSRRVLHLRDVTTRRLRERELERMAYTDHLTGLPNRAPLFAELNRPSDDPRCLLVLDLDGFKAVNDGAGHEAGDQLLVEVARRLHTVVRDDDLVARLGGDEFAVLLGGSLADGEEVATRVVDVMALPFHAGGDTFGVGTSVGVARLGAAGGQTAFRAADGALREAKRAGKGCVRLAPDGPLPTSAKGDISLADAQVEGTTSIRLDAACAADGRIELVHALPVYSHPARGTARGLELWTAADRYGQTAALQEWLLRGACGLIATLDDPLLTLAVSLPPGAVPGDGLARQVASALADADLPPSRLVLSFTEETLLTSPASLVPELEAVRRSGVRLCLDGYGMGHSLFALLARVPLDLVRVDLKALATRGDSDRALEVLAAIGGTTDRLGLVSIAGGVSTAEQRDGAVAAGIHLLHGRALPHDLTVDDLAALLAAGEPAAV